MLQADLDPDWRAESAPEGLANYFCFGYPTGVYWEIDWFVRGRLIQHLQRRSQRPCRPPKGAAWYTPLQRLGCWSVWPARLNRGLGMPEERVFGRAGRGKSASLVRRGEGGAQPCGCHSLSYSTGSVPSRGRQGVVFAHAAGAPPKRGCGKLPSRKPLNCCFAGRVARHKAAT